MKHLFFVIGFFYVISTYAQQSETNEKIEWLTWTEAIEARNTFMKEKQDSIRSGKLAPKKIFIDVYTSWCGWCKKMDATTFKNPFVVKYMNKHFYPVKLNAEMKDTIVYDGHKFFNPSPVGKKGTHMLAASLLDSKMSYPTYVIMDENIHRSHIIPGYKNGQDLFGILNFFGSNNYLNYKKYIEESVKRKNATLKEGQK